MQVNTMYVYYGVDFLPYKDKERVVHYPIVGGAFQGASNTTKIRFYIEEIGEVDANWIAIAKLPNGKIGSQILSTYYDSEVEEWYAEMSLSQFYTQYKGDVYISLNGYTKGSITYNDDTGLYESENDPIVQATGSIKLAINYAPQYVNSGVEDEITFEDIYGALGDKLNKNSSMYIKVVSSIDNINTSDYENYLTGADIVYDKAHDRYYSLSGEYPTLVATIIEHIVTIPNDATFPYQLSDSEVNNLKAVDGVVLYKNLVYSYWFGSASSVQKQFHNKIIETNGANKVHIVDNGFSLLLSNGKISPTASIDKNVYTVEKVDIELGALGTRIDQSGHSLEMTIDSNYDLVIKLKDKNGNVISTQDVDLPLESIVVSATYYDTYTYDGETYEKVIVIVLATTDIPTIVPVGDLVSGLVDTATLNSALATKQDLIDSSHKLESDLVDDTNQTNKFVTTSEKTTWNAKQDELVSGTNIKTLNGTTLLGSGNYAFDIAFDENSTNALENRVISKEIKELNYELAIIREELFEVVLTELDYTEDFATLYAIPDSISDSDGTHRVVYSETELKSISGNTVVDNQLVEQYDTNTSNGVTLTKNNDGSFTLNGTATGADAFSKITNVVISFINGHKYLFHGFCKENEPNFYYYINNPYTYWNKATIWVETENRTRNVFYKVLQGNTVNNEKVYPQVIDLTQMFPINTPTTLDDNRVKWLLSRGYIAYNTGSLLTGSYSGLKINSRNLLDVSTRVVGKIKNDSGVEVNDSVSNYFSIMIPVQPNQKITSNFKVQRFYYYDISGNWLRRTPAPQGIGTFTVPSDVYFIQVQVAINDLGGVSLSDLMLHYGDTLLPYVPYGVISTISIPTTELPSAGTAHEYIEVVEGNVVEGEQLYNLVKHTIVGSYTFTGNESWNSISNDRYVCAIIQSLVKRPLDSEKANLIINSGFSVSNKNNVGGSNGLIAIGEDGVIYVHDTNNITSSSTAQSYMAGKTIYYELATPTQETIATDLHFNEISSIIEQGGSIETLFTNVPPNSTTTFVVKKAVGE